MKLDFGKQLLVARKAAGISRRILGTEVGCTLLTIRRWEMGESFPSISRARAIARKFPAIRWDYKCPHCGCSQVLK